MKWARRYRARLRAAIRAGLGAWRQRANEDARDVFRFEWGQEITGALLRDAQPWMAEWVGKKASLDIREAILDKQRELGVRV